jgi:2-dehydropantoate 2-reductase
VRFLVYGAGAIGGVIGGRLHEHGHDVVLIARGPHYEAIRAHGLRLESPDAQIVLATPVVDDPRRIDFRDDDVVVLAMKSQDTDAALRHLVAVDRPEIPIVCAQNGVANERAAARHFRNVYGMTVMCPTVHLEPGVVQAVSSPVSGLLDVGRFPHGVDSTAETICAALSSATFESVPRPDIMRWKYGKLLMNLSNAVEAVCGTGTRGNELAVRARAEGVECLHAAGIAFVDSDEDRARRGDLLKRRPGDTRSSGASSWQSLSRVTGSIESDYLNGEIVLLGRLHGIPTPVNELLQREANRLARERRPPGSVPAERLLELLRGVDAGA